MPGSIRKAQIRNRVRDLLRRHAIVRAPRFRGASQSTAHLREPTDLPIDLIVTPERSIAIDPILMRPKGLHPSMITPERLRDFPGLRAILAREGIVVPGGRT